MTHVQAFYSYATFFSRWLVLLWFLYIELALVCCTNPDNVHCFSTISPNLMFLHQSAPLVRSPCNPTNTEVAQLSNDTAGAARLVRMGGNQKQRCGSEFAKWHDIYTPDEYADEWRQSNTDLKLLCREWFHRVRHHVHDGHCTGEFATVIWRLDSFTVLFHGDVRGESGLRKLASVNWRTPQWANGRKLLCQFEKWRKWHTKFFYLCWFWSSLNCDVFPLLMMDNTRKMN